MPASFHNHDHNHRITMQLAEMQFEGIERIARLIFYGPTGMALLLLLTFCGAVGVSYWLVMKFRAGGGR